MARKELSQFANLTFDDFKRMAKDSSLNNNEKIGFPDIYRKGKEKIIFSDILSKAPFLEKKKNLSIVDIGCGCGKLTDLFIQLSIKKNHELILVDSQEMLEQVHSKSSRIKKFPGFFPEMPEFINRYKNKVDFVLVYSVFHYVFYHDDIFKFLDVALSLLRTGGSLLIGDIPNSSKRKRFFSSNAGIKFHQSFTKSKSLPDIKKMQAEPAIDDAVMFAIMQRYRSAGYETFLLPQIPDLPMNNRREDILIVKY